MEKAYKNVSYLIGAVLLLILIGFFKTYFGLFPHFEGLPLLAHFHAIMILSWFGLLIAQPLLIRYRRPDLHRLLGKASYLIVPLMAISMILMMHMSQIKTKNVFIFFKGAPSHSPEQPPIPNISSTGMLGKWSQAGFVNLFHTGKIPEGHVLSKYMPVKDFTYSDDELKAIYLYLHGVK